MVPLPLYITTALSNLEVGFSDFRLELAQFIGYRSDSTLWTSAQNSELGRSVNEAYRWILFPQTIPGERIPHTWSFMEQTTTITTEEDEYLYTLPSAFGSFVGKYMYWPTNNGYTPPCRTNDGDILSKRQYSNTTGRPTHFAIRWAAQTPGSTQRQEVMFWPTPDDDYTLTYRYAIASRPLSETNRYCLGGPRISQLMIEACKAIGETKKNGQRGDQWNLFIAELQSAIQLDKGTSTSPTLGMMAGDDGHLYPSQVSSTTYYFGPSASYGASLYLAET